MKKFPVQSLNLIVCCAAILISNHIKSQNFNYPPTPKQPVTENIFGKIVVDNYRWLEDANNQQVQDWVKSQADFTNRILDKIPGRNVLIEEYKKLDGIRSANLSLFIIRESGRYFYKKTMAGENVAKLYYRETKTGNEVLLFDPGTYTADKTKTVTFNFLPSKDGKKVALSLTESGNLDISTVRIINVDSKKFDPESLYPVSSVQAWSPDSKGFIYGALQTDDKLSTNLFQDIQLKYHQLGTPVMNDKTILSRSNNLNLELKAADLLSVNYSSDNKYLIATLWSGAQTQNRKLYAPASGLALNQVNWQTLVKAEDQVRDVLIYKEKIYLVSRKDAPNYKILVSPLKDFDINKSQILVPEGKHEIGWVKLSKDYLFIQKKDDNNFLWEQYDFSNGKFQSINLPYSGSAFIYCLDETSNECIMNVFSWNQPGKRFDYDPLSQKTSISIFNITAEYPGTEDIVVEELEVKSHDGVMVPLSLIYNKNIKKDGENVVYMTGFGSYGGYGFPFFDPMNLPLLNRGVIIAITHPRGGGEKGFAWYMGGFKATKPNTWKDFIACGEYLIDKGYTSAKHLIGEGTSAGGILIGRAITERPDLFAVAINNVPVSNPLRGENRPNGILDSKEFGTAKDSTEAMGLIEMDAYLHVTAGVRYPAVIAVTGINDTRVPVWQPAKFVAALQAANASDQPIVLQVNYDSGHLSEEKNVTFRNNANMFAFALWQAGHKDFQPVKK